MIRDRIDKYYVGYEGGLSEDSVDLISGQGWKEPFAGSNQGYFELIQFIEDNDLSEEENYEYVISEIDIHNYIDYTVAEMYLANYDWPGNNVKIWRPSDGSKRWRWIFFDLGLAFKGINFNMFDHCTNEDEEVGWPNPVGSTFLFRNLIKNQSFVELFINRYAQVLSDDFNISNLINLESSTKRIYEDEMKKNIRRWHYPDSYSAWEEAFSSVILDFLEERPCVVVNNIRAFFNLEEFTFDCESALNIGSLIAAPNPSGGSFTLINNSLSSLQGDLKIVNIAGRSIYNQQSVSLQAFETLDLSIEGASPGLYILDFQGAYSHTLLKIVIQ